MVWSIDERGVTFTRRLEGGIELGFRADNIRQERTGIHARVSVSQDRRRIGGDSFNVERERDRTHLVNSCFGRLGKVERETYTKALFAIDMDDFCLGLWTQWMQRYAAEDISGDPELGPPAYVLAPWILGGGGTILFSPPGWGKSTTLLLMAQSINAGVSRYWSCRQQPVLYINLERSRLSLQRRMVHINGALGLEPSTPLLMQNARGRSLTDVIDGIELTIRERKVGVVFLDSLTRAGYGDLTQNEPANRIMDALNGLSDSWIAAAHTPRSDSTHAFGSQMYDAAADIIVQLLGQRMDDGRLGVGLQCRKANDIPFPPMEVWALEFDQHGLAVFREAKRSEFPEIEAGRQMSWLDSAREYLLRVGEADASEISALVGKDRSTVSRGLVAGKMRTRRDGHRVLYSVPMQ